LTLAKVTAKNDPPESTRALCDFHRPGFCLDFHPDFCLDFHPAGLDFHPFHDHEGRDVSSIFEQEYEEVSKGQEDESTIKRI
jgi:hypothetical protein